jgi:putative peptidoglycan lipid II flippase
VGHTTMLVVPIAIISRGAAFLIPVFVAIWFGVGPNTDAWFWALAFPTFAVVLSGSAVATTVTPALAALRRDAHWSMGKVIGSLMMWTGIFALVAGVLICLAAPNILKNYTRFEPETQGLAATLLWELLPFMVVTAMAAVLRSACEVMGFFKRVAVSPLLRAVVVIGFSWLLLRPAGIHALPWGLVAGEVVAAMWWGAWLVSNGIDIEPNLDREPTVKQVGKDIIPILGGEVLVAANLVVDKGFASTLSEGSVTILEFADRARIIPTTLMNSTLAMVAFASWSNLVADGKLAQARENMDQSMRWTMALAAPMLAGMYIGRFVLIGMVFEHGAFDHADTVMTGTVLGAYIPGLLATLLGLLAIRAHIVERNFQIIFTLGAASVMVNFTLNNLLIGPFGLVGLAVSTSFNNTLITLISVLCLVHLLPVGMLKRWAGPLAIAFASVVLAGALELGVGAPQTIGDAQLWLSAIPCFALFGLGLGLIMTERPR